MTLDWRNWRTYRPTALCFFGGGDYCMYCGRDGCSSGPCEYLQNARLSLIPDNEIAAFGCSLESGLIADDIPLEHVWHCDKWCHKSKCPFTLKGTQG